MNKSFILSLAYGLCLALAGHAQETTWTYDFGTNSGSISGATTNTTLLPAPEEGGGSQYLRIGSGGGSFTLTNSGSGSQLIGAASSSPSSVNKFAIYDFSNPTGMFSVSFDANFSGGSSGNWSFFAGNGTSFDSAGLNFNSAQTFTGLRFQYGASEGISVSNNNSGTWQAVSGTGITKNSTFNISIFGNNSSSSVSYLNSGTNALAANTYDLWVGGTKVASALSKSSLADLSLVDSFMFVGASSTGNVATLTLDNITYANFLEAPAPVVWTGSGVGGTWAVGQQGGFSSPYANNSVVGVEFSGVGETVTVSGAVEAGLLRFASTGFVLSGGTVTNARGSITVASGTTTIDSTLGGTNGIIKTGAGTLILSGNNSFSGNVVLSSGTLQIASDANLGNAANDLVMGGTLRTTSSVALGADRNLSGAGTLDIADGTTLTVNGATALNGVTLVNTGTLALANVASDLGNITTSFGSGTAVISGDVNFSGSDKVVSVASGGTLEMSGSLNLPTALGTELRKEGEGVLHLSGTGSTISRVQIGSTGPTPTAGGVLRVDNASGLGAQEILLYTGTLELTTGISTTNGISLGGRTNGVAVIGGGGGSGALIVEGVARFFRGNNTGGELRLDVDNVTTFAGGIGATSGGGTASGVTIGGSGELVISGVSSALTDNITLTDTVQLTLSNAIGGGVAVGSGNRLAGSGTIGGSLSFASGAKFVFSLNETMDVNGDSVSFANFGVTDLVGLDINTPVGVYTIFGGSATIDTNGLRNFGAANAFVLGDGKTAYFSEGSLKLNVVPEPSTYALLALTGAGVAGYMIRRRRC